MVAFGDGTRDDHLRLCKQRALEYVGHGNCREALASFISDVGKHPETASLQMFYSHGMHACLQGPDAMRRFIEGVS